MSSLVISPNRNPIPLLPLVIETVLLARSRRSVYLQVERHLINEGKDIYHDNLIQITTDLVLFFVARADRMMVVVILL
jgi:hypothetical protein